MKIFGAGSKKNRNIGAGSGSGSQKKEISGPGPGPDSEKISGLISGPGTRNKPNNVIQLNFLFRLFLTLLWNMFLMIGSQ